MGLGRCHIYFFLQDKDVDLTDYINVYNVSSYNDYEIKVDDDFYNHLHMVNYGFDVYHEDNCNSDFLSFYLDKDKYDIPVNTDDEEDEEFDNFVKENNLAYPIENFLDGWWESEYQLYEAISSFIEETAQQKVHYELD